MGLHPLLHETLAGIYGGDAVNRVFGAAVAPPADPVDDDAERVVVRDELEAERFRLECERDAGLGALSDWPDD